MILSIHSFGNSFNKRVNMSIFVELYSVPGTGNTEPTSDACHRLTAVCRLCGALLTGPGCLGDLASEFL